ncbi:protein-tyrosine-phosphatase [Acididesulfobacillus acetoxydans]|uniref:Protein-tyrosine-phosphatase n=1 Tax=Acididesulfobacillus acetoxydans TaxID=1561005 RepID=A0A8S0WE07_9FIRM|nr:low molecular weight protein arginine phosphatase [Acididesulfobacillus acetoxydans]CAA7599742.1 protein-tyrosine-phosphatase [Acididesulfobacillus acetoxydans]CEJ06293.1 Protein-tyrosine-phosphatase [Acididesulfobacillus acetoxydans]
MDILFVCSGNTCRSPMAEAIAKSMFGSGVRVHSAGIGAWEGDGASPQALKVMEERGLSLWEHRATRLTRSLVAGASWVIPMTRDQERVLKENYPESAGKIRRLGDWGQMSADVTDPWGGSLERYRECAHEIARLLEDVRAALAGPEENRA